MSEGDTQARREAADWFARLSRTQVTSEDIRAFSAWRSDPANAAAYRDAEAVWAASAGLKADPQVQAVLKQARESRPSASRRRMPGPAAVAVTATLVAALAIAAWLFLRPVDLTTDVGEQRTVRLADGSELILDTDSRVRVRLQADRRLLTLMRGQAYFVVEPDPTRPFVVRAGDTEVVALGTRFGVRRLTSGARVVLVEGAVSVAENDAEPWRLAPGEAIATDRPRPAVAPVDARTATSWTQGRLVFDKVPLAEAVAEVNRYTTGKLVLDSPDLADIRVSGVFDADDTDAFVAAVSDLYGLQREPTASGGVRLVRRA